MACGRRLWCRKGSIQRLLGGLGAVGFIASRRLGQDAQLLEGLGKTLPQFADLGQHLLSSPIPCGQRPANIIDLRGNLAQLQHTNLSGLHYTPWSREAQRPRAPVRPPAHTKSPASEKSMLAGLDMILSAWALGQASAPLSPALPLPAWAGCGRLGTKHKLAIHSAVRIARPSGIALGPAPWWPRNRWVGADQQHTWEERRHGSAERADSARW